jgi:type IV fimbrial biogenesis protein FimT
MNRMIGRTLVELAMCVFFSGVIFTMAIPLFSSTIQRNQQTQSINQMLGAMHYARSSAALRNKTTTICSGHTSCTPGKLWHKHLLVFDDTNENGQLDADEKPLQQFHIANNHSWYWSNFRRRTFLQFAADGTTRALNGTLTLCSDNTPIKQVVINLAGRTRAQAPAKDARCS